MKMEPNSQYLGNGHADTLEEVGREFGVTRKSIMQIESRALRKARKILREQGISTPQELIDAYP